MKNSKIRWAFVVLVCSTLVYASTGLVCHAQQGMKERYPNVASNKLLPEGNGIAAKFKADVGIDKHPSVAFACDFETGDLETKWDEPTKWDEKSGRAPLVFSDPGNPLLGKRCLKVEATLGQNSGGGYHKWFDLPAESVFVRFYVKFDPNCDYIHHFVMVRANKGLRGGDRWTGFGGAGGKPTGDERFSTGLEPVGNWGRFPAPGVWNFYSYWHDMEPSRDGKYWGNQFLPDPPPNIPKDKWICAEFMVKHNTPGKPDGEQAFWIDGKLIGHWRGINWRNSPTLKVNALTLESYVTDSWTKNPINTVYFDNIVIAKEYIGPASNP